MDKPRKLTVDSFIQMFQQKTPFTFSRWGDGEWRSVMRKDKGANCDGHPFYPEMGHDLREVLRSRPPYIMGMQNLAVREYSFMIDPWLAEEGLEFDWVDSDVFHKAAVAGELDPMVEMLRKRRMIVVGPEHLKRAQPLLNYDIYVEVPGENCYLDRHRIITEVLAHMTEDSPYTVISISASMPAEIIVHKLWEELGEHHAIVDFGSLWDQYVGVKSRKYMKAGTPPISK